MLDIVDEVCGKAGGHIGLGRLGSGQPAAGQPFGGSMAGAEALCLEYHEVGADSVLDLFAARGPAVRMLVEFLEDDVAFFRQLALDVAQRPVAHRQEQLVADCEWIHVSLRSRSLLFRLDRDSVFRDRRFGFPRRIFHCLPWRIGPV